MKQEVFVCRLCREFFFYANVSVRRHDRNHQFQDSGFRDSSDEARNMSCFGTKSTPGVDSGGGEQEAAQAAVGVALAFALRVAVGKRLDDLHKGLWENSCLVIDCSL